MTHDTVHLRDEMLIASDCYQQLEWFERAVNEAHQTTVQRAYGLLDQVDKMLEDRDNLSDAQRVKLLRILHEVEEQISDLKWVAS